VKRRESFVKKRTVSINGRVSSISMEDAFWLPLKKIAAEEGFTIVELGKTD
jgi:predicted DNA-binding ribbon-helix-helix protein